MSLIPSESYSFPDHFSRTVTPSRKPKKIEPEPQETLSNQPGIVALPDPELLPVAQMLEKAPEPVRKVVPPVPNPALRRASAPPPRVSAGPPRAIAPTPSLKKAQPITRLPAMEPRPSSRNGNGTGPLIPETLMPPAQNIIQMLPIEFTQPRPSVPRPASVRRPQNPPPPLPVRVVRPKPVAMPKPTPPPRAVAPVAPVARVVSIPTVAPAVVPAPFVVPPPAAVAPPVPVAAPTPRSSHASTPQDFFEIFAQSGETALSKRRRKTKMRKFLVYEGIAVGILVPIAILGLTFRPDNAILHWTLNILTLTAAFAAAVIPILFFAGTPTLPEIER